MENILTNLPQVINLLYIDVIFYIAIFLAIMLDLFSGIRKAKQRNELRTSYGYKRTVDKISRYFNAIFVLSIIDIVITILMVHNWFNIPALPYLTGLGTLGLCFIELKSIYEKSEDKVKINDAAHMLSQVIKNKDDGDKILEEIKNYLESKQNDKVSKSK